MVLFSNTKTVNVLLYLQIIFSILQIIIAVETFLLT